MIQRLPSVLRFLLVPLVVFLTYGIVTAIIVTVDTQFAPAAPVFRAILYAVGAAGAFVAVLAGSTMAPSARLWVGAAIVIVITASQLLQLPKPETLARALVYWASLVTLAGGLLGLVFVAYREHRRAGQAIQRGGSPPGA